MRITPELMVKDIKQSLDFYREVLGFTVNVSFPEEKPIFALVLQGNAQIMLYEEAEFRNEMPHIKQPIGGTIALYIDVENIESWKEKVKDKIVINLHTTSYGTKEFACLDPDGYIIIFAENIT